MPITSYTPDPTKIDQSLSGINNAFVAVRSDDNYFENPSRPGQLVISKAIRLDINTDDVTLVLASGLTVTYPAGSLAAGVPHPIHAVRLNDSDTGGDVVVIVEY